MRLEAEQVTKQYQMDPKKARFAYALSRTDLVVESGEFAVITGKSGSGKSTLLHILAGLLQPTSGCVLAGGKDLYRMADGELSKFRNENIAVIPQGGGAIYSLTAEENIRLARNICGRQEEKDILPLMKELGDRTAERRISIRTFRRRAAPRGHRESAFPGNRDPSCRRADF